MANPHTVTIDPSTLERIARVLKEAGDAGIEKRKLVEIANFHEASYQATRKLATALHDAGIYTLPAFEEAPFDQILQLASTNNSLPVPVSLEPASNLQKVTAALGNTAVEPEDNISPALSLESDEPKLTLGALVRPFRSIVSSGATVRQATTSMIAEGQSFCAVRKSARDIHGLVFWSDIATGLSSEGITILSPITAVMRPNVPTYSDSMSVFDAMPILAEQPVLVVYSRKDGVLGGVTSQELIKALHSLTAPFLILSRIEAELRRLLDAAFSREEMQKAKDPRDTRREIRSADDLNFGEYLRLLEDTDNWTRSSLRGYDRPTVIEWMRRVNGVRNSVMHFRSSAIGVDDRGSLERFYQFLSERR